MIVLGIETSCDETGIALYDSDKGILAEALYSQIELHAEYGGVVPELASRDHIRRVIPLVDEVIKQANIKSSDIDGIALPGMPMGTPGMPGNKEAPYVIYQLIDGEYSVFMTI